MDFHELSNKYPLMVGAEFKQLCDDILANGLREPIILFAGKILDGRNRHRACVASGVEPRYEEYVGDDPEAFVDSLNLHRRHLSAEAQSKARAERVARVAEARSAGESLPSIAESEGVSIAQVQRDLEKSGLPGGKPETKDGKVTGKDGKKYEASKPKKSNPEANGATKNQVSEREPGDDSESEAAATNGQATRGTRSTQGQFDATGQAVPTNLRDIFGDTWINDARANVGRVLDGMSVHGLKTALKGKSRHYPFLRAADVLQHFDDARTALEACLETLIAGQADIVCRLCAGEGCDDCRRCGHVPKWRHEELIQQGVVKP